MRRRFASKEVWRLLILILLVTFVLLTFGSSVLMTPKTYYFSQLDEGWTIKRGNETLDATSISAVNLGRSKAGEVITLSGTLPDENLIVPTIMFKTVLSTLVVKLDGDIIYTYGQEYAEKGRLVPQRFHIITLEKDAGPHDIEITLTTTENNGFRVLKPIYYGTRREVIKEFLQTNRLTIFIGGFLIIYSCLLFSLGVYMALLRKKNPSLFFSAAISMLFAVYIYAYNDIFCFISDRDYLFSIAEYITLYLTPLSVSVLLISTYPDIAKRRQRTFLILNILFPVTCAILHTCGIHLNHFVQFYQILSIVEMMLTLPSLTIGVHRKRKQRLDSTTYTGIDPDNYLLMGFIFIIFFGLLEIAKFNVIRVSGEGSLFANISFLTLGVLYFVICLFVYYLLNGIEHLNSAIIKERLKGLAYTDALTGLMNRAKCTQYLASLNVPYAIVSFDLDRLKFVNDTYGHIEGDKMLKAFAELLKKAFDGASLIGRTGGDEFLVAIENPSADICDKCIRSLEQSMAEFNKTGEKFTLSASAGYAYSHESKSGFFKEVFYLADNRMYEMKERHHHA